MARNLSFSREEIQDVINESISYADAIEKLGYTDRNSGGAFKMLKRHLTAYEIDISHFTRKRSIVITKICEKCGNEFQTLKRRQRTFCSKSCANGSRPTGTMHPSFDPNGKMAYVHLCFENHEKKCVVCGEDLIVEAHHYDGNHDNNDVTNFVPLCPTHHRYAHSTQSHLYIIKECIDDYVKKYYKSYQSQIYVHCLGQTRVM